MKKSLIIAIAVFIASSASVQAQLYKGTGKLSFYSKTPVEDIDAHSQTLNGFLNPQKKEFAFLVANPSFEFKNKLMQEHFNEKYMESDKYPTSVFKGKINEDVDLTKDGVYNVNAVGKLIVHGVEKDRTIPATITVKDGKMQIKSEFKVLVKDHNIQIPKLVVANIAEEITVMVDTTMEPKK